MKKLKFQKLKLRNKNKKFKFINKIMKKNKMK